MTGRFCCELRVVAAENSLLNVLNEAESDMLAASRMAIPSASEESARGGRLRVRPVKGETILILARLRLEGCVS